jgi:hypothetical protein
MTEAEWLACTSPYKMLRFLRWARRVSFRTGQFIACAFCRQTWPLFGEPELRRAVEEAEKVPDHPERQPAYRHYRKLRDRAYRQGVFFPPAKIIAARWSRLRAATTTGLTAGRRGRNVAFAATLAATWTVQVPPQPTRVAQAVVEVRRHTEGRSAARATSREQRGLIRDVFGNPFRPSPPLRPAVLAWNDATVRRIAEGIYEDRAFGRLPILADALLDAGCEDEELPVHCRSEGPHVRGCWAVDLILGKS